MVLLYRDLEVKTFKKSKKYLIIGIFAFLVSITVIFLIIEFINEQPTISSNGQVQVEVEIPVKTSELYARNQLLSGITYYYDVKVTMKNLLD